ncbi:hypothetical protein GH714_004675 [Hevea brasiliensis]|uniref:Uncharacterized protein n=1 Tax=Hevea brasiliensis TaxID=3981 RepID=A0A6A6N2F7_HEVBR|nr:hypothetical protein GH714_004675 [Hevea brasiliensis]
MPDNARRSRGGVLALAELGGIWILTPDGVTVDFAFFVMESSRHDLQRDDVICKGKVCDLVIGGSMKNIISKEIVDKLKLPTIKHPHPYEVGWLKKGHVIPATSQHLVKLTMGGNLEDFM